MRRSEKTTRPVVLFPGEITQRDGAPWHSVHERYMAGLVQAFSALPLIVPALYEGKEEELLQVVNLCDGIVLTGSRTNVYPKRYGGVVCEAAEPYDQRRDGLTMSLIEISLKHKIPLFAICRGFQELNVALGGTLIPAFDLLPGRLLHRAPENVDDDNVDEDIVFAPRHFVSLRKEGFLETIVGARHFMVNSAHTQAVDRLAAGLNMEAQADDGTVEAVSLCEAHPFFLGVQWHPEYKPRSDCISMKMFSAFRQAMLDCRQNKARATP